MKIEKRLYIDKKWVIPHDRKERIKSKCKTKLLNSPNKQTKELNKNIEHAS